MNNRSTLHSTSIFVAISFEEIVAKKKEKHSCCSIPSIIYFDHLGEEKKWIGTEEKEVVLLHFG